MPPSKTSPLKVVVTTDITADADARLRRLAALILGSVDVENLRASAPVPVKANDRKSDDNDPCEAA